MSVKKIIGKIHLWLGLTSGLVVFIIAITGCIYAFQVEIQNVTQPYRFVEPWNKDFLPPSALNEIAVKEFPGKKVHSIEYGRMEDAARVTFYSSDPEYYYITYLNPYTGEVLKVKDMEWDFFSIVLDGHFYLWLPEKIGQPIVASATLIFVLMLITGIILWWPKNKAARKQRFTIKWNVRWRRKNYDLHNVMGFYMSWVVIFIALTGLVWGFQWFSNSVYFVASGGKEMKKYKEPRSDTTFYPAQTNVFAVDKIWNKMKTETPDAASIEVHFPEEKESSIAANSSPDAMTYWKRDYRYFDQYTLKELSVDHMYGKFANASGADKLMRMNYDIHVGAIWGLPGKCLAFFASLVAASLPVTGFMIWYGRRKKKNIMGSDQV